MRKNKQSARSLTAFIVTWSFLVLTVTGLVLYIIPHGRVAYWIHWDLAGLEKDQWGGVHMIFGGMFIISGILHLYFNWKPFKKYFADRVRGHLQLKQEIVIATILTLVIFMLSVFNLPPASWVFDFNAKIKESWITSPELEPPFGHAEEVSVAVLSRKTGFDISSVMSALEKSQIKFENKQQSLESIARQNNITPMQVYAIIQKTGKQQQSDISLLSAEEIQAEYAGTGLGRKTILEITQAVGINPDMAVSRLNEANIKAGVGDKLKELAETHELTPLDLLLIMSGKQY